MIEPLTPVQQNEVLQDITERLLLALPAGWNLLQVDHKSLGDHVESGGLLRMANGGMFGWDLPAGVRNLFAFLRVGMARPGHGTWWHATYWLDYPDRYSIEYNRRDLPRFRIPPPRSAYARELEIFPRADERVPRWLRAAATDSCPPAPLGCPPRYSLFRQGAHLCASCLVQHPCRCAHTLTPDGSPIIASRP